MSGDQVKKKEIGGACSTYGERRGLYRVLVGKHEGKGPLGRAKRKWKDNIKIEWDLGDIDWIDLA